ncbi:MAG: HAD family hydrolase [Candidatus Dormibacteraeota bacterium]|nr:HAD family hydrolase [Candidatus Dormibacteraeota bacterium]
MPADPSDGPERLARVARLLPEPAADEAAAFIAYVDGTNQNPDPRRLAQLTDLSIAGWLRSRAITPDPDRVRALRRALALPVAGRIDLLPGAPDLLQGGRRRGLSTVVLSNTDYRDAEIYARDLAALGVADLLDAIVSSVDLGLRKPHPAAFGAALRQAGCRPGEAMMVGNTPWADIEPARALGLHAVQVAIDDPPPASAPRVALVRDSLAEVLDTLDALA